MSPRYLVAFALALVAVVAGAASVSGEEKWPTRPVRFIVTLGPGSGADIGARLLADRLPQRWGQPVIVDNRPGGDGLVAINAFVTAHDDHVLLYSPASSFTAHPYLHDNLSYKPDDLLPIVRVSNTIIVIAVPVNLTINSVKDLAAAIRAEPGKLNWAGVTGTNDLFFGGWLMQEGLSMNKVPYRNPVDAANDLAEGRVQIYEAALAIVRPQLQAGKIKLIAATNSARAPTLPDVPTVAEAGFPALTQDGLVGLFGPSGMPRPLRERIAADVRAVVDATIVDRLTITGQLTNIGGPDDFAQSVDEQRAKVARFGAMLGIKPSQ
jgi:tripartite-type tricarboxylate transporter receptor subunit TctC